MEAIATNITSSIKCRRCGGVAFLENGRCVACTVDIQEEADFLRRRIYPLDVKMANIVGRTIAGLLQDGKHARALVALRDGIADSRMPRTTGENTPVIHMPLAIAAMEKLQHCGCFTAGDVCKMTSRMMRWAGFLDSQIVEVDAALEILGMIRTSDISVVADPRKEPSIVCYLCGMLKAYDGADKKKDGWRCGDCKGWKPKKSCRTATNGKLVASL